MQPTRVLVPMCHQSTLTLRRKTRSCDIANQIKSSPSPLANGCARLLTDVTHVQTVLSPGDAKLFARAASGSFPKRTEPGAGREATGKRASLGFSLGPRSLGPRSLGLSPGPAASGPSLLPCRSRGPGWTALRSRSSAPSAASAWPAAPRPTCTVLGPRLVTGGGWQGVRTMKSCFCREALLTRLKARTCTVSSPSLRGDRAGAREADGLTTCASATAEARHAAIRCPLADPPPAGRDRRPLADWWHPRFGRQASTWGGGVHGLAALSTAGASLGPHGRGVLDPCLGV